MSFHSEDVDLTIFSGTLEGALSKNEEYNQRVFLIIIMLFWTSFSAAEPISVNSTADNTTEDEECTLREAIENAQGASHVDCVAGTIGLDEIRFNYDENHAPVVLDNSNPISLTDINEDVLDTNNTGDQIAKLIKGMIKDADGDKVGIAVIAVDNRQGKWQYFAEGNTEFIDFPNEVTESQAVLLNDQAKIRFVPNANYNGTFYKMDRWLC
ncbi:MAG TPA: CSLREA domain-containing protein [Thiotrichaceae bacterium]|nr:CSLREA domain-containing protein [Thiotrichaceae bacterium]